MVDKTPTSTSSMTRLVTMTDTGEPTAVPKLCWWHAPRQARNVASRQKVQQSDDLVGREGGVVWWCGVLPTWRRRSFAIEHTSCTGTGREKELT